MKNLLIGGLLLFCFYARAQWVKMPMQDVTGSDLANSRLITINDTLHFFDYASGGAYYYDASAPGWKKIGDDLKTYRINELAKCGSHYIMATSDGIYVNQNLTAAFVLKKSENDYKAIFRMESNGSTAIGMSNTALFRSTDEGETWVKLTPNITGLYGYQDIVWHKNRLFCLSDSGLFYSDNKGDSWNMSPAFQYITGYGNRLIQNDQVLYFISDSLRYSVDNGITWHFIRDSFSNVADFASVSLHGNTLLFGTRGGMNANTLYTSVDSGKTVLPYPSSNLNIYSYNMCTGFSGNMPFVLIPRVGISAYNGTTWNNAMNGMSFPRIRSTTSIGNRLIVSSPGLIGHGLFLSTDQGNHWSELPSPDSSSFSSSSPLINHQGRLVLADDYVTSTTGDFVFFNGFFYSDDSGASWHKADVSALKRGVNISFTKLFAYKNILIASGYNFDCYSDDNGASWKMMTWIGSRILSSGVINDTLYVASEQFPNIQWSTDGIRFSNISCMVENLFGFNGIVRFSNKTYLARSSEGSGLPDTGLYEADLRDCKKSKKLRTDAVFEGGVIDDLMYLITNGRRDILFSRDAEHWTAVNAGLPAGTDYRLHDVTVAGAYVYADRFRIPLAYIKQQVPLLPTGQHEIAPPATPAVYPNPVHEQTVFIKGAYLPEELALYNMMGREIPLLLSSDGERTAIHWTAELPHGLYLLATPRGTVKVLINQQSF